MHAAISAFTIKETALSYKVTFSDYRADRDCEKSSNSLEVFHRRPSTFKDPYTARQSYLRTSITICKSG